MNCPVCHNIVEEDTIFCQYCGSSLEQILNLKNQITKLDQENMKNDYESFFTSKQEENYVIQRNHLGREYNLLTSTEETFFGMAEFLLDRLGEEISKHTKKLIILIGLFCFASLLGRPNGLLAVLNGIFTLVTLIGFLIFGGYLFYKFLTGSFTTIVLVDSSGQEIHIDYENIGIKYFFYDDVYEIHKIIKREKTLSFENDLKFRISCNNKVVAECFPKNNKKYMNEYRVENFERGIFIIHLLEENTNILALFLIGVSLIKSDYRLNRKRKVHIPHS